MPIILSLTDREATMLEATSSILSVRSTIDLYKDDYGKLLGKLLNEKKRQRKRYLR
jgi:hypothetical protein